MISLIVGVCSVFSGEFRHGKAVAGGHSSMHHERLRLERGLNFLMSFLTASCIKELFSLVL